MSETLLLRITGRVQGVGFRAFAVREARSLGLRGWVRNRQDGSVEALVSGNEGDVARFVALCQAGPRAAAVQGISTASSAETAPEGFIERATV